MRKQDIVKPNLASDGTFARASIASFFDYSKGEMVDYASGERRLVNIPIVSAGSFEHRKHEGMGSTTLKIVCYNSNYVFAVDGYNYKMYRSKDGDNWEDITPTSPSIYSTEFNNQYKSMYTMGNDRLLRVVPDGTHFHPYYSDDNGSTWVEAKDGGGSSVDFLACGSPFGFYVNPDTGTVIFGSYGTGATSVVMRSVNNGANWSVCITNSYLNSTLGIDTIGPICYHRKLKLWILNTGDGGDDAFDLVSSDDGANWSRFGDSSSYSRAGQYYCFLDYDDPTKLLVGSMQQGGIHTLDLITGDIEPVNMNWTMVPGTATSFRRMCTKIIKFRGLYYACKSDNGGGVIKETGISVSSDLINWREYVRCVETGRTSIMHFGGYFGGNLHFDITNNPLLGNTYSHMLVVPAHIEMATGLVMEPAVTNAAYSADVSEGNVVNTVNQCDNGGSNATGSIVTDVKLHGVGAAKYEDSAPASGRSVTARFYSGNLTPASTYYARAYVRGYASGLYGNASRDGCFCKLADQATPYARFEIGKKRWFPVISALHTQGGVETTPSEVVFTGYDNRDISGNWAGNIIADCFQIAPVPVTSWQVAGTPRVAETFNIPMTLESDWLIGFTIIPQCHYLNCGTGLLYVCTIEKTYNTYYISVYWNPSDNKWYMVPSDTGVAKSTETCRFGIEDQLTIVISRHNAKIRMFVGDASAILCTGDTADTSGFTVGSCTFRSGNATGGALLPHILTNLWYINRRGRFDMSGIACLNGMVNAYNGTCRELNYAKGVGRGKA